MIGIMPDIPFATQTVQIESPAKIFLYSDGAYEIRLNSGEMWEFNEFVNFLCNAANDTPVMDQLLTQIRKLQRLEQLDDDFSIMQIDL